MKKYYVRGPGGLASVFTVVNGWITNVEGSHTQNWIGNRWHEVVRNGYKATLIEEAPMFDGDGTYDVVWTPVSGPNEGKRFAGNVTIHNGRISNVGGSLVSSWSGIPYQSLENYFKHNCRDSVVTKRKSKPNLYVEVAAAVQQARKDERDKIVFSLEQRASFIRGAVERLGRRNISDPGSDYEEYIKQSAVLRYLEGWIRELKGRA